jgi:hypothetical protein
MDRSVQIDVALIAKIMGLPTMGETMIEYMDNKAHEKEIIELVKEQFWHEQRK